MEADGAGSVTCLMGDFKISGAEILGYVTRNISSFVYCSFIYLFIYFWFI
jgi:hypothetical protein